jgi:hypothetical protein
MEDKLRLYRLRWKQSYGASNGYTIQSHRTIRCAHTEVTEFFGRLEFDLVKRQILFELDVLVVLNITVYLDQVKTNAPQTLAYNRDLASRKSRLSKGFKN